MPLIQLVPEDQAARDDVVDHGRAVLPGQPDQVPRVSKGCWGCLDRLPEDRTKVGANRTEPTGRCEPEVDLEAGRQEKCAVDGSGDREVEVMRGPKLAIEVAAPIRDDRIEGQVGGDAEVQVDVGPAVLPARRRRAGHRSSRDPGVLLGEPEQLPSHRSSMITGEHSAESSWHIAGTRL